MLVRHFFQLKENNPHRKFEETSYKIYKKKMLLSGKQYDVRIYFDERIQNNSNSLNYSD